MFYILILLSIHFRSHSQQLPGERERERERERGSGIVRGPNFDHLTTTSSGLTSQP